MKCRIFGHLKKTTLLLLAALLSFLPLLSGVLSESVSAYTSGYTYSDGVWRVKVGGSLSTWVASGEGQLIQHGSAIDAYNFANPNFNHFPPFLEGDTVVFSGSFIWAMDYSQNATNTMPSFTCPTIAMSDQYSNPAFTSIDCDFSVATDVMGTQHYIIYSWSNVATVTRSIEVGDLTFAMFMKETNGRNGFLFSSALTIGKGDSSTLDSIHDFNTDMATRIQRLIDTVDAYGLAINNNLSLILNSLNPNGSIYEKLDDILDAIGQSGTTQQGIENAINNSMESQEDKVQDASDDAQDSADSNGQQAESAGTTLLGAFTSFVGAVTSASPTSCVISGNLGIGGFSTGDLDLCAFSPPPVLQVVSSLIMIGVLVPISIFTAKKMINLFRSFTNG